MNTEKATCPVASPLTQTSNDGEGVKIALAIDPLTASPADLPHLLDECDRLEDQISTIRQRARDLLTAGRPILGWRLVTLTMRRLIDTEAAFNRIWTDYGLEVAVRCIKLSLPDAAAALAHARDIPPKKAQEQINRTLGDLIATTPSSRLVRAP